MPDEPQLTEPLELFYSYSHKDEDLRDELETHLSMLRRQKVISQWHDRGIPAGEEWGGEIDEHLKAADIILLLVSSDFLASEYCYDIELKLAMERHEAGESRVIPVILRSCDWSGAPFGKLQALPKNVKPVTTWPNRDEAFTDIAKGIRKAAEEFSTRRKPPESSTDTTADAPTAGRPKTASSQIPRPPVVGFVARRDEQGRDIVERLKEDLAPEKNQLVALWGPGGTGKTTIAAEVVRVTEGVFAGRVVWTSPLQRADFSSATLVDEIAHQLGREDLRRLAFKPKGERVAKLVAEAPTFVILDNFETVAEEEQTRCLDFLVPLSRSPVLITTRSFVNRDDVSNVPLAAMSLEEARDFCERLIKRTRKPSIFADLDRDELIRRCEANPLVLQWVVRQIELANRPQDVLRDLERGEGDAALRVFMRSFNLPRLGDDGRATLFALSLFVPDASREALAEVAGFGDDLRRLDRAVESLSALWLVEATERNERLFLRGLTRELARSQLSKEHRAVEFRRRYVARFLRHAEAHSRPATQDFAALQTEKDNLLGALDAAFHLRDWNSLTHIAAALKEFVDLRGYWCEWLRLTESFIKATRAEGKRLVTAIFLRDAALYYRRRGDLEQAKAAFEEALGAFEESGDGHGQASVLRQLGKIAHFRGDYGAARSFYERSLTIIRSLGCERAEAITLHALGTLEKDERNLGEARRLFEESLRIKEAIGDERGVYRTKTELGALAHLEGRMEEARRLYEEALAGEERLGGLKCIADLKHHLGVLELDQSYLDKAQLRFGESLKIAEDIGDTFRAANTKYKLGQVVREKADWSEAYRLMNEARAVFAKYDSPMAQVINAELQALQYEFEEAGFSNAG